MTPQKHILIGLLSVVPGLFPGCLYDGEGTEGLPCNRDADCGAQACVEKVCGGPADTDSVDAGSNSDTEDRETDTHGGSDSTGLQPPTQQMLPEPCAAGSQECVGSNALSWCDDDGKLRSFACEAICGADDPVDGGCRTNPQDGRDYCWCASNGGPPTPTCSQTCSGDSDCGPGEACLYTTAGNQCLAAACETCFDSGLSCYSGTLSCRFDYCG